MHGPPESLCHHTMLLSRHNLSFRVLYNSEVLQIMTTRIGKYEYLYHQELSVEYHVETMLSTFPLCCQIHSSHLNSAHTKTDIIKLDVVHQSPQNLQPLLTFMPKAL